MLWLFHKLHQTYEAAADSLVSPSSLFFRGFVAL